MDSRDTSSGESRVKELGASAAGSAQHCSILFETALRSITLHMSQLDSSQQH